MQAVRWHAANEVRLDEVAEPGLPDGMGHEAAAPTESLAVAPGA
jgi:hypothetical protein